MIAVVARLPVAEGKEAEFESVMAELASQVLDNEEGCKLYKLCKPLQPGPYVMIERYVDQEAFSVHAKTPYFQAAFGKLGALLSGAPEIEILSEL
ncbi:MAG: antibiotic biosynthesis monooxygenase [Myxococcales bacterium]|nr:antibiotic biosynthesis monooxygenase [Myxococcales bacterium]